MSIESDADWRGLRTVGHIVRLTLDALEQEARPGITTGELDKVAARVFAAHGARSAPSLVYGFPGTVLISVNDEVVHGVPGSRRLRRGDLVKLDVTAEKDGYMADAARTVVLEGESEIARQLRACVRSALARALKVARAGRLVSEIGRTVEAEVRRHGFSVVRTLGGHGIGRTIHEAPSVPNYGNPLQREVLTEGLVLAIEPIISAGSGAVFEDRDGWTIKTKDRSLAAHHEHTVVITRSHPVLLTAA
jgi:methionyl aminopeptidase